MSTHHPPAAASYDLRAAHVLRVEEECCEVWVEGRSRRVRFAPMFPTPRVERVSPGHLVAIATGPDGAEAVVWRWFDAVVLGTEADGSVRLWEPAHGEVVAQPRSSYRDQEPGSRAYASAGLPGAEWWVTGSDVELAEVHGLYAEHDGWSAVFAPGA